MVLMQKMEARTRACLEIYLEKAKREKLFGNQSKDLSTKQRPLLEMNSGTSITSGSRKYELGIERCDFEWMRAIQFPILIANDGGSIEIFRIHTTCA
mmetsp:Transcript_22424/g.30682  ORF Transcript_22424/g.30682 Transcript_22424/m.30682 type:complete len:97 (+) Transcript_22424:628-918(+)